MGKKTAWTYSPRLPFFAVLHVGRLDQHRLSIVSVILIISKNVIRITYSCITWRVENKCALLVVEEVEQMSASVRRNGWERKIMGLVLSSLSSLCFYKSFMVLQKPSSKASLHLCHPISSSYFDTFYIHIVPLNRIEQISLSQDN